MRRLLLPGEAVSGLSALAIVMVEAGLAAMPAQREVFLSGDLSLGIRYPEALGTVLAAAQKRLPQACCEQVWLACFTMKGDLVGTFLVAEGSTLTVSIYTRRIVQAALKCNASALLLLHNHLAPDVTPSREDVEATERLQEVLTPLELALVDHVIVSEDGQMRAILGKIDPEAEMRLHLRSATSIPAIDETEDLAHE